MEVIFLRSFLKDVQEIKDSKLKQAIKSSILEFENAENLAQLSDVQKLKGHPDAYRRRIGNYRLGFFYENQKMELARFVKRNDIYKLFP